MISVGLFTSSLSSGHAQRGVGYYTGNLLSQLKILGPKQGINITEVPNQAALTAGRFDIVHYPFFDLFYPTLPLIKPARTVVTIHDVTPLKFPGHYPPGLRGAINFRLQQLSLMSATRVITDSYASVIDLRRYLHLPDRKIRLIYLAAAPHFQIIKDKSELQRVRNKYHLPTRFVLYVGDINYNKNLPALISSCLDLKTPLVLVGKNAAQIEKLDLTHPELAHLQSVIPLLSSLLIARPGFVPDADLPAFYNLATLYCQPSYAEGFGLSVLEAMACGCPVVSSRTSSLPEVAGDAAVLFDPSVPQALPAALTRVYTNPTLRQKLSSAGPAQAAGFSWTKAAAQTLDVYREVL